MFVEQPLRKQNPIMDFIKKEPIIFLIAGKARSGKSTVGNYYESCCKH